MDIFVYGVKQHEVLELAFLTGLFCNHLWSDFKLEYSQYRNTNVDDTVSLPAHIAEVYSFQFITAVGGVHVGPRDQIIRMQEWKKLPCDSTDLFPLRIVEDFDISVIKAYIVPVWPYIVQFESKRCFKDVIARRFS